MRELNCCNCGTKFAMEDGIYLQRKTDGKYFTCPNGHEQHFSESENKKLKDKVASMEKQLSSVCRQRNTWRGIAESTGRSLSATKGVVTKLKMKLYPERYKE